MADNELLPETITDDDREAAARLEGFKPGDIGWDNYISGYHDRSANVVAFARHRLATTDNAELVGALRPFAEAAENIPDDQEDFKIVAHVPAGQHADAFRRMSATLTAGAFRRARDAYALARTEQQP